MSRTVINPDLSLTLNPKPQTLNRGRAHDVKKPFLVLLELAVWAALSLRRIARRTTTACSRCGLRVAFGVRRGGLTRIPIIIPIMGRGFITQGFGLGLQPSCENDYFGVGSPKLPSSFFWKP